MARYDDLKTNMAGLDPFSTPIPGESLTTNPENRLSYESPPAHTHQEKAIEDLFMRMTEEDMLDQFLDLMREKVPVEYIAQVILFEGFRNGMFNPDLMLMLIEPTIYILLYLADYANIDDVVLYAEGSTSSVIPSVSLEAQETGPLTESSGEGAINVGNQTVQRPESVPSSLLQRITTGNQGVANNGA